MLEPVSKFAVPGEVVIVTRMQCCEPTKAGNKCRAEAVYQLLTKKGTLHPLCSSHLRVLEKRGYITQHLAQDSNLVQQD